MNSPSLEEWLRILAILGLILIHVLPVPLIVEEAEGAPSADEVAPPPRDPGAAAAPSQTTAGHAPLAIPSAGAAALP